MTKAAPEAVSIAAPQLDIRSRKRRTQIRFRATVSLTQIAVMAAFLAAWQWLPTIGAFRRLGHVFDPFFVSSPSRVAVGLDHLFTQNSSVLWSYIEHTVFASLAGLAIGLFAGALVGLVVASSRFLGSVFRPLLIALNAVPRIALIPIIVIVVGPTYTGSILIAISVVFFIAFFSAYEGATTVPPAYIQNAQVLEASAAATMWHVRLPYVLAWTFSTLPVAGTYALLAVVTGEILTGFTGLGRLIALAAAEANATLAISVAVTLAVIGLLIVGATELLTRRLLHWWGR